MELSIATGTATAVETQMVESVLPEHFESSAPELIKLLKAYYRHLNTELKPSFELNNLIRQHDVDTASTRYLDAIERMIASAIPKSRSLDRVRLYKIIADYYNARGSEESIYAFFRIFYNEFITLVYPKEVLFTVADIEKGTTSTVNKIRDSFKYQEFSYVVKSQADEADWRNEYLKFVHPAGLKFFVALTLEIIHDNDWIKEALEFYLDVTKVVKLTSELPTGANAPANGTLYIVTDADDLGGSVTRFNNIPRVYEYKTSTSPEGWAETQAVEAFADFIDWDTFFGRHSPLHQYLNIAFTFLIQVLMGDGGFHYLIHTRSIFDKEGKGGVDRDLLKAFFNNFIICYYAVNQNTIQTAYRDTWNKDGKFIDNAGWGEFGNLSISEADAEYTKVSDGAFRFASAFEPLEESSDPFLTFIDSSLIIEDFNEPANSPITYLPTYLSSTEYKEGWVSFIFDAGDPSPFSIDQNLIRFTSDDDSPETASFIRIYNDRIEIGNDLLQVGDVYVNGDLVLNRDETNYQHSTTATFDTDVPLLDGGFKQVLLKYKWKLPTGTITSESGIDPAFRALFEDAAFSSTTLNIQRFKEAVPDIVNRLQGNIRFSDTASAFEVSYNTHFNNFSTEALIDFYTLSYLGQFNIAEFDFIINVHEDFSPDSPEQEATEHFVFTGTTNVVDGNSPEAIIDTLHTFESDNSNLFFQFSESNRYWGLYTSDSSPEGELIFVNREPWTTDHIPELFELDFTQWETIASYDDSTPLFGSSYALAAIVSDGRFINPIYNTAWTDNSPPFDSPLNSRSFLGGLDDSPVGYEIDTQEPFLNSFTFTQD